MPTFDRRQRKTREFRFFFADNCGSWVKTPPDLPIISVDSKKKELIGNFKNAGSVWCAQPEEVNVYDFPSAADCRATAYGMYLISECPSVNASWPVNVARMGMPATPELTRHDPPVRPPSPDSASASGLPHP